MNEPVSPEIADAVRRTVRAGACRQAASTDVAEAGVWTQVAEVESARARRALARFGLQNLAADREA